MTAISYQTAVPADAPLPAWKSAVLAAVRNPRILVGGAILLLIAGACLVTIPLTTNPQHPLYYDGQFDHPVRNAPDASPPLWFGTDTKGRSILGRCLMGGVISLAVGLAAAVISVVLGVTVGLISGFRGGWVDSLLMRSVDIMYGLPYILLVILLKMALDRHPSLVTGWWTDALLMVFAVGLGLITVLARSKDAAAIGEFDARRSLTKGVLIVIALGLALTAAMGPLPNVPLTMSQTNIVVLFLAIGLVSWLTMARVIRGQVLSLRGQPFVEAARAVGLRESRIFLRHILPNLVGPITVYTTLTIPQAILQESFLSFLGIGVLPPMPSWGGLASENRLAALDLNNPQWWMLVFPCILLALTLLSLNFVGDGMRDLFDPKSETTKL